MSKQFGYRVFSPLVSSPSEKQIGTARLGIWFGTLLIFLALCFIPNFSGHPVVLKTWLKGKKQVWATTSQFTPPIPLIYQSNDPNSFVSQSNHSTILATLSPRHIFIPIDFKVEIWNLIHWCAKIQRGFTFLPPKPIWVVWKVVISFIGQFVFQRKML